MMQNYLVIIKRNDFDNFYRFGHIFIHNAQPLAGDFKDHIKDHNLFKALTAFMDSYEYSNEYLILEFRIPVYTGTIVEISLEDVIGIYAIDSMSQNSLAKTLDPRIHVQVSGWSDYFKALNKKQYLRSALKGRDNCFEIFEISSNDQQKVLEFLPLELLEDVFKDLFAGIPPQGAKPIWIYLLRYQRHNPYFKDQRGFFCDAMHAYENYLQQQETDVDIIDEAPLAELLNQAKANFNEIYNSIINSELNKYKIDNCNYLAVAPIYLYLRSYFKGEGITSATLEKNDLISTLYPTYGFDFSLAVGLLGITLGHKLSANFYYQKKNINIFKETIAPKIDQTKSDTSPISKEAEELVITRDDTQLLLEAYVQRIKELEQTIREFEANKSQTSTSLDQFEKLKKETIAELNQEDPKILEETISEFENNKSTNIASTNQTKKLNGENKSKPQQDANSTAQNLPKNPNAVDQAEASQDDSKILDDAVSASQDQPKNLNKKSKTKAKKENSKIKDANSATQDSTINPNKKTKAKSSKDDPKILTDTNSDPQNSLKNLNTDNEAEISQDTPKISDDTVGSSQDQPQSLDNDAEAQISKDDPEIPYDALNSTNDQPQSLNDDANSQISQDIPNISDDAVGASQDQTQSLDDNAEAQISKDDPEIPYDALNSTYDQPQNLNDTAEAQISKDNPEILYDALNSAYDQPQNLNDENEFKSQDISKTNKDSQTLKDQSLETEKNSSEFKSIILKKPNKNGKITKKSKKVTAHSQEEYDKYISEGYTDNYERDIDDYEQFSLLS